jgi:hypothetical protein
MIRVNVDVGDNEDWSQMATAIRRDTLARMREVIDRASAAMLRDIRARLATPGRSQAGAPPAYVTGELRAAFAVLPARLGRNGSSVVGGVTIPAETRGGSPWWHIVGALEYGSSHIGGAGKRTWDKRKQRGATKGLGVYHARPRPFLRPAEAAAQAELDAALAEVMG